jgi:hypothetical protein
VSHRELKLELKSEKYFIFYLEIIFTYSETARKLKSTMKTCGYQTCHLLSKTKKGND